MTGDRFPIFLSDSCKEHGELTLLMRKAVQLDYDYVTFKQSSVEKRYLYAFRLEDGLPEMENGCDFAAIIDGNY